MAGRAEVRCVGPSAQLADRKAGVQRTVNMYLSAVEGLGEGRQFILKSCPGATVGQSTESAPIRGLVSSADSELIFYVVGSALIAFDYRDNSIETYTGSLLTTTGRVRMVVGQDLVVIVDGDFGYVVDLDLKTVTRITDADWRGSTQAEFLDGYYIFAARDSDQFYISAIDNPQSLAALDFSSADRMPDKIVGILVHRQELYVFGTNSTEVWINSPTGSTFPFQRYVSAPIDIGLVSENAVVRTSDSIFMIGKTARGQAMVFAMAGHSPRRVSTIAVEEDLLADGVSLADCTMWTYQASGAEFVAVEAHGMSSTWVYDIATQQWHERCRTGSNGDFTRMEILDVGSVAGLHYAAAPVNDGSGDWALFNLSTDAYTWAGDTLHRERTWPHLVSPSAEPVRYDSLELMCSTGNGGNVSLEISNDGGYTWGSVLWRSLGTTGRFMQRVRWLMLGQARDRVFRIRCSDDVPFNIHGAQLESSP